MQVDGARYFDIDASGEILVIARRLPGMGGTHMLTKVWFFSLEMKFTLAINTLVSGFAFNINCMHTLRLKLLFKFLYLWDLQMSLIPPHEVEDILLPSGTKAVKDLRVSPAHSRLSLLASLGKKLSVLR